MKTAAKSLCGAAYLVIAASAVSAPAGEIEVRFDASSRTWTLADRETGPFLEDIEITLPPDAGDLRTTEPSLILEKKETSEEGTHAVVLRFARPGASGSRLELRFETNDARLEARLFATWPQASGEAFLKAALALGPVPLVGHLLSERSSDRRVIATALGPALFPSARSALDLRRDIAVSFPSKEAQILPSSAAGGPPVLFSSAPAGGAVLEVRLIRHYVKDVLGGLPGFPSDASDASVQGSEGTAGPHRLTAARTREILRAAAGWIGSGSATDLLRAPAERLRLDAIGLALTGRLPAPAPGMEVPQEAVRILKLCRPAAEVLPVNLYPLEKGSADAYDLIDLRIARPWGQWDSVGLLNPGPGDRKAVLDLGRLDLEPGSYHIWDFWEESYLGVHASSDRLAFELTGREGKLFSIRRATDGPVLLSTSRHLSQGGIDLVSAEQRKGEGTRILEGVSEDMTAGEPYILTFAAAGLAAVGACTENGTARASLAGGVARLEILPRRSSVARWALILAAPRGPFLDVDRTFIDLGEFRESGEGRIQPLEASFSVKTLGTGSLAWSARCDDPQVRIEPSRGVLGPDPGSIPVKIILDGAGMRPGGLLRTSLEIRSSDAADRINLRLRAHRAPPANLARGARASASGSRGALFEAAKAIDGIDATCWQGRREAGQGSWIELEWKEPVEFDQVVVDVDQDASPPLRGWALEAGSPGQPLAIASGDRLGADHPIDLARTKTTRLRLRFLDAGEGTDGGPGPAIREIRIHRLRREF